MFPVYVQKFHKHDELKEQILSLLETAEHRKETEHDTITKTDWGLELPVGIPNYQKLVLPHIVDHSQKVFNRGAALQINEMWFQQYMQNDTHSWHVHEYCHWANVYFVELPTPDSITQILDLERNEIKYTANEGDIVSFPSMYLHRSKPNKSIDRKTVIAYNINFTHVRMHDPLIDEQVDG
jgi:hypothetical protein